LPAGFDAAGFLRGAKMNFAKLQLANDLGKLDEIREFATDEMFEELKKDLAERGGVRQQTDVIGLEAELLELTTEGDRHWASVRFSGAVRESPGAEAADFAEVWHLVKPADGSSGWLLAGIQQMH
jgi:predicted lipid-binding transport protein (Tim44 family)